eukprot:11225217-Lingulodinium_polyedra.AAC.1
MPVSQAMPLRPPAVLGKGCHEQLLCVLALVLWILSHRCGDAATVPRGHLRSFVGGSGAWHGMVTGVGTTGTAFGAIAELAEG